MIAQSIRKYEDKYHQHVNQLQQLQITDFFRNRQPEQQVNPPHDPSSDDDAASVVSAFDFEEF